MNVEREVIIDLLPAYFSGEASAATRALVEEYFRQDPDFERIARGANKSVEGLKAPFAPLDDAREKLALERARQVMQTRSAFFWLAVCYTLILLLFRVHEGKIVWIMWGTSPTVGMTFTALAVFFWLFYLRVRRRCEPLPTYTIFFWLAFFYTLLTLLFRIQDHKIKPVFFGADPTAGFIFAGLAVVLWGVYFYQRWKARVTRD
ncbi:MAG: hypothetical protein LAO20_09055 [Acidobacteriia bacterium]|nr:hypothetical protein [Terriglobia bacterium]